MVKLDRKALPSVDFDTLLNVKDENQEPQTEMETKVHAIWCDLLTHVPCISIFKTLFELRWKLYNTHETPTTLRESFKTKCGHN